MITSPNNPGAKLIRALAAPNPRARREEKAFVVEGIRAVEEGLSAAAPRLIFFDPEALARTPRGKNLLARLDRNRQAEEASPQVLAAVSETVHAQGVVAVFPISQWDGPKPSDNHLLLILDGVRDPGNLGTILRAAEAAATGAVYLSPDSVDPYNPKVVRAAMGAHFRLPIFPDAGVPQLATEMARLNVLHLAALDVHARTPYYSANWREPSALIVGGEAHGLSKEALTLATTSVTIPMPGGAESLNAAMATGIVLFEALRQRAVS